MKKKLKRFFALRRNADGGFTLVELIVVIAILAILAGVAVPAYNGYIKKANQAADETLIAEINMAFRAACIENYCDAYDISAAAWDKGNMTVASVEGDGAHPIVAAFDRYFDVSDPVLKYYSDLRFDGALHQFVPKESNFEDEAVMNEMRLTLDGIADYFVQGLNMNLSGDALKAWLTKGMNEELIDALGLNGMVEGYNAAMAITDTDLDAILKDKIPGYEGMSEDEKNEYRLTYKANLGLMYFAEDAAKQNPENVANSVENFIGILMSKDDQVSDEDLEAYYLATAAPEDVAEYMDENTTDYRRQELLNNFRTNPEAIAINDDLKFTGEQAAAMAAAAKGTENTGGASTLASMYALAAGYYNSDYYDPETDGTKPSSYGDFDSVTKALENESFFEYMAKQGKTDLEYYLEYMASMSKDPNVDLTKPDAFAGLSGQG